MANSSPVYDWFQERLEIQDIADDISSKYVPPPRQYLLLLGRHHIGVLPDPVRHWIRNDLLLQADRCGGL